jgi:hypothetical protein
VNGYTLDTPTQILIGSGVVYRAGVPWSTSRGGLRVELIRELREVEFDGRRAPVAGLDRVVTYGIRVTATFLELNVLQSQRYEQGIVASVSLGNSTLTPRDANQFFPAGAYITDTLVAFQRSDGTLVGFRIPKAFVGYTLAGEDKSEAGIDTTFEARADLSVLGIADAPYTIEFDTSGVVEPETDAHMALITALGGDSVVDAFYVTTDGTTGLADESVVHSGGMVDEWNDYRGDVGYAPLLAGVGTTRPAWSFPEIIGDGTDDFLVTALDSRFSLAAAKSLIVIGTAPTADNYVAAMADSASANRLLGIDRPTGGGSVIRMRAFGGGENVASLVAGGSTVRVMFASTNGTTTGAIQVANQAKVTGAITEINAGDNYLAMFGYGVSGGKSASAIRAVIVLNRDFTAGDVTTITDWAVLNLSAVAA